MNAIFAPPPTKPRLLRQSDNLMVRQSIRTTTQSPVSREDNLPSHSKNIYQDLKNLLANTSNIEDKMC